MNQQQLQIARTALWHQNGTRLETHDAAAAWLEEMGFCLFLPRHAQFPAPAPSLVEALLGSASATPTPAAVSKAMELTTGMVEAGQAIPLNLLGTFSEQPDFLVTAEVLPWVAAIRGDRQWKTAPGGRTTPIVVRTWEALDQRGPQTAAQLREALGREVTEAAVLRALIELWTTLRATPVYTTGEATRWHLMKERFSSQLATAATAAQATALSALISLYLRSAVAVTGEEVEIFLSPLTARSRIREVLHGMTAARQLGTMSVASHTLLFVEGSLPEVTAEPEPQPALAVPHKPERRDWREERGRRPERSGREGRERRERRPERFERENRGDRFARPARREFRPAARGREERAPGRAPDKGREQRRESKPWQKRRGGDFQQREGRPPFRKAFGQREERTGQRQERPPLGKAFREQGQREQRPRSGTGPRPQFGKRMEGRPQRGAQDRQGRPQGPGRKFAGPSRFERGDRGRGGPGERREFRGERPGQRERAEAGVRPGRGRRPEGGNRGAPRTGKKGGGTFNPSSRPKSKGPRKNGKQKPGREEGSE